MPARTPLPSAPEEPEAHDDEALALWRRTVETLTERGASPAEAIEGANLLVEAFRRKRAEGDPKGTRSSGVRKKT